MLAVIDLVQTEEDALEADWVELCRWDPMLPPDCRPPEANELIRAVAAALAEPQPLAWGPDPELETAASDFAVAVGSVAVAIEELICLRQAFQRRILTEVPQGEVLETHARLNMAIDRAIGVAAHRATSHLESEALTDPLTGLSNRRALERNLRRELARSGRHHRTFTVVMIDLDGLKAVNDRDGHAGGDRLLRRLAGDLVAALRASDSAYRIGGDEFALVLPETPPDHAHALIERVADAGAPAFSWGTASFPEDGVAPADLVEVADRRLYERKGARRGGRPVSA